MKNLIFLPGVMEVQKTLIYYDILMYGHSEPLFNFLVAYMQEQNKYGCACPIVVSWGEN